MKLLLLFFSVCFCFSSFFSQLEDAQLDSLKKIWKSDLKAEWKVIEAKIERENGYSDFSDSIKRIFESDTFLVEGLYFKQLDADQSTFGMNRATSDCEKAYDVLLNKYYKLLLKKLSDQDKQLLINTQRNWLKFRTSEKELNGLLFEEKYSGGGTIQTLFYSAQDLEYTKQRVFQLVDYLYRIL